MTEPLDHHAALIFAMVTMSAVDRTMTDAELARIGEIVSNLPVFADFDQERLVKTAEACGGVLSEDGGLDRVLMLIKGGLPKKLRDSIDVMGHAFFLMPLCIVMIITGGPFFMRSFEINEQSGNAGGLPQWPAKSLIIIGFTMLLVQAISELIKRIAVMRGLMPDPHAAQVHALEAEVEHLVEAIEKR